jgi:ribosome-associated protein
VITIRGVAIPEHELSWRFSRSSGPGGQNVNKRDTRVEVSFDVANTTAFGRTLKARALERLGGRLNDGVLTVAASDQRTQARNREVALERLRDTLEEALRPPPRVRVPTRPSRPAKERRLAEKRKRAEIKRDRRGPVLD